MADAWGRGLVVMLVALGLPLRAAAYCRSTTVEPPEDQLCASEGVELAWFDRCSTLHIVPRDTPGLSFETLVETTQASFDAWSAVQCDAQPVGLAMTVAAVPFDASDADTPTINTMRFIDDPAEWQARMNITGALAVTAVMFNTCTGRIVGADIDVNDWLYDFGVCEGACDAGVADLQNTLTHEAGHYYGLGHVPLGDPATMEVGSTPGETRKRTLERDDVAGLCAVYPAGTFAEACTGSTYDEARACDGGCACSAVGHVKSGSWVAFLIAALAAWQWHRTRCRSQ